MRSGFLAAACVAAIAAVESAAHAAEAGRPPAVPPEQAARPIAAVALVNAGFESTAPDAGGAPEGWMVGQHAGPVSYTFTPDADRARSGRRSLRIDNVGPEPYGTIDQSVDAVSLRGKTLRFSAWLRTRDVKGNAFGSGAALRMQTMRGGYVVDQAQMRRDAVAGNTDWTRYELHLRVAGSADRIDVGVDLFGAGTLWIDDAALDVVDPPIAPRAGTDAATQAAAGR